MDKIYSRRRIKLPRTVSSYSGNGKWKAITKIIFIILIAMLTAYSIIQAVEPIFEDLAMQEARTIATIVMNQKTSEVLSRNDYKDLVWVIEDEEGNNILRTDVVTINKIASEIAIEVETALQDAQNHKVEIAIGALTGSKYLAGSGPKIPLKIVPSGNVTTELKTEFKTQGINQTIYRIYLELGCDIRILTPYENLEHNIVNQVLLVETVIVGKIPQTYYNLEGLTEEDSMEVIGN